jgi:sigma-E factor negative regulatory protein RseA
MSTPNQAVPMDAELAERISALLDNAGTAQDVDALLATDASGHLARACFASHALVGDALRGFSPKRDNADFLSALHKRLLNESIAIENIATKQDGTPAISGFSSKSAVLGLPEAPADLSRGRPAANDSRWRLVAGFASFAAVAALGFGGWQAQRAASADARLAAAQNQSVAPVFASTQGNAQAVLIDGRAEVMLRDPRMLELVAQHRQLGGGVHHTQAGFFRASTIQTGAR